MSTVAAPMTFKQVLGITVMRRLWYAQIVSLLGDFLALFAVISVVSFKLHGTPAQVTGVQIAYMLPLALLGPLAGVFVDRWPLKPTLVSSDLIRAGLVLLLVLSSALWQVYAILIALSSVSSFFSPAQSVTIRSHVPREGLLSANALMQIAMMGIRIVGPAAAGALVAAFGAQVCYAVDGVSFLASAALIGTIVIVRPPAPAAAQSANNRIHQVWVDMIEGVKYIIHHAALSFVVTAMAAGLFTNALDDVIRLPRLRFVVDSNAYPLLRDRDPLERAGFVPIAEAGDFVIYGRAVTSTPTGQVTPVPPSPQ